jgi:hypothetical protein
MPIVRAKDVYLPPPHLAANAWDHLPPAERVIAWMEHDQRRRVPRPDRVDEDRPVRARVDAGRWIADCDVCGSATVVDPDDPRLFCVVCATNLPTELAWRPVVFPAKARRERLEADLETSGRPHERTWWDDDDPSPRNPKRRRRRRGEDVLSDGVLDVTTLAPDGTPAPQSSTPPAPVAPPNPGRSAAEVTPALPTAATANPDETKGKK